MRNLGYPFKHRFGSSELFTQTRPAGMVFFYVHLDVLVGTSSYLELPKSSNFSKRCTVTFQVANSSYL